MKTIQTEGTVKEKQTWEEESGLIEFLSSINAEVDRFNSRFAFGIQTMAGVPAAIDDDTQLPLKTGFVLERNNPLYPEVTYCLYSLLKDHGLYGYIALCRERRLITLRELQPIRNFKKGSIVLYKWMGQLVRASFEKIML